MSEGCIYSVCFCLLLVVGNPTGSRGRASSWQSSPQAHAKDNQVSTVCGGLSVGREREGESEGEGGADASKDYTCS